MEVYAAGKILYTIKGYKMEMFHGPIWLPEGIH